VLLEIGIKSQHFSIVFEPRWLNTRNVVILRRLPGLLKAEIVQRLGHLINEILVNFLFEELPLLLLRTIYEVELLSLVVVLLIRIVEDMSGQERHLLWNIHLHYLLKLYFYLYHTLNLHLI